MGESEPQLKTNKKAVLAFVLAIFGLVLTPALLAAVVLWLLVRRDIRRDPNQRGFKLASIGVGFSLVVCVLVQGFIVMLLLDHEPRRLLKVLRFVERSFFSGTQARNEAEAIETMLVSRGALNKFHATNGGYPGSLNELIEAGLLDSRHAQPVIGRYTFTYEVFRSDLVQGKKVFSRFLISARPQPLFARTRIIMTETGEIGVYDPRDEGLVEKRIPPPDDWTGPASVERNEDSAPSSELLDLNSATVEELQALPGIGPATAKAIVRFREKGGPFRRVEDLLAVRGITKARLEKLRPHVIVRTEAGSKEKRK